MSHGINRSLPASPGGPFAALHVRSYRLYLIGWFVALMGTRVQAIAIGWEMYQRTGDALALGLVGLAQALPTMLLALPAGYLADRISRPKLIVFSLAGVMVTSLGLATLSYTHGSVALMYVLLFLDAAALMIGRPARVALIPQMVPKEVFPNAVMWNTTLSQISAVAGPMVGGFVVAWSIPAAYVISATGSLVFLVLLTQINLRFPTRPIGAASLQSLLAGVEYVWKSRIIFTMISLDMFAVLLGGAVYLLPIYATDILHVGATGFGWLQSAPAMGAFITAALLIFLPPMQRAGRALLLTITGFGLATIVFAVSRSFWLSFSMLFLTGAFDNVSMVIRQTLLQLLTPDHMRGRVSAVSSVFVGASNELGGLESGMVAHWFGPVLSALSGGIGTLIVVGVAAVASPRLRAFGALHEARPEHEEVETASLLTNQAASITGAAED